MIYSFSLPDWFVVISHKKKTNEQNEQILRHQAHPNINCKQTSVHFEPLKFEQVNLFEGFSEIKKMRKMHHYRGGKCT